MSRSSLVLFASLLLACSSESTDVAPADSATNDSVATDSATTAPDTSTPDDVADSSTDTRPPLGAPITAPKSTWTWVDFADSACDDGSKTGIGINPGDSGNVLVFHNGGGACWDANTCLVLHTSSNGPFGSAQFASISGSLNGTIFDRTASANPFKDWSFVFVPYCTGDLHAGDNVMTYTTSSGTKQEFHHVGRKNVKAYLTRLGATFTAPSKVLITGASAGGYGALFDYDLYRAMWPAAKSYLLDDSGPLLVGDDISASLRTAWFTSWRLDKFLDESCPTCRDDLSALITARSAKFPDDRIGLLSTTQDQTIRTYLGLSPTAFETALLKLATTVYDPTARGRYFITTGNQHVMLTAPSSFTTAGVNATTWIQRMVADDSTWASIKP